MEAFEAAYRLIPSLRPRIMMAGSDFPPAGGRFWDFLRPSRGSSNWAGYLGFRYAAPGYATFTAARLAAVREPWDGRSQSRNTPGSQVSREVADSHESWKPSAISELPTLRYLQRVHL
jgi:hypothetical protein